MACKHKYQHHQTLQYFYWSGRYSKTYVEQVKLFCEKCGELKDQKREAFINEGQEYKLPDWARPIYTHYQHLDASRY